MRNGVTRANRTRRPAQKSTSSVSSWKCYASSSRINRPKCLPLRSKVGSSNLTQIIKLSSAHNGNMDKVLESLTAEKDQNLASPITNASSSTGVSSMTNPMSPPVSSASLTQAQTQAQAQAQHQLSALSAHRLAFPFVSPSQRLEMNLAQHLQQQQAMFPFQQFRGIK